MRRQAIFTDHVDYLTYLELLATVGRKRGWTILGFALLPNHLHLILKLAEPDLSVGMKWLQYMHARRFNLRHGYVGHAFDSRFFSRAILTEEHLFRALSYLALNPVHAGLCSDPAEWRWSSFATVAAERDEHDFVAARRVRALYGSTQIAGARGYAEAVRSSIPTEIAL